MNKTITRNIKITKWNIREVVDHLGDVSSMTDTSTVETIIANRRAVVQDWFDADGNGYEQTVTTLHDWE